MENDENNSKLAEIPAKNQPILRQKTQKPPQALWQGELFSASLVLSMVLRPLKSPHRTL
jgi:hypothetical protein